MRCLTIAERDRASLIEQERVHVAEPEFGVQPGFQGNITVDQANGNVYTVFSDQAGSGLYLARSTDGGQNWILKLVFQAPVGVTIQNVFPVVAVDGASNAHIVFSDNRNVYVTSSHDQGASFTPPVRANNGAGTKTVAPWVTAGSGGQAERLLVGGRRTPLAG